MASTPRAADLSVAVWVDALQASGRYTFTRRDLKALSSKSKIAMAAALRRLQKKGSLRSPRRGFYIVVPVEYRVAGSPPAPWFVSDFMRFLGQRYYVGILSAAALHGAAHQQPMAFQVVTDRVTRGASAGRVRIEFHKSRDLRRAEVVEMQTDTGTMRVASPEWTAFDLVRYPAAAGYWSNVATVLVELADRMEPDVLARCAVGHATPDVQRLGYLLEFVGKPELAASLAKSLEGRRVRAVLLAPKQKAGRLKPHPRWRVVPNVKIEVDS
jgi:predicted transcriptional regulator of viral defense system